MEQRSRLPRKVKSRSTDSSLYGDDEEEDSEVDEIQEKLDRILGSDSNSDISYTPGKDDPDTDEDEAMKDSDSDRNSTNNQGSEKNNESEDYSSGDSDIERIRANFESNLAKKLQKPVKSDKEDVRKKDKYVNRPAEDRKSKETQWKNLVYFKDIRSVPSLYKETVEVFHPKLGDKEVSQRHKNLYNHVGMSEHVNHVKRYIQRSVPKNLEDCSIYLVNILKQPKEFFFARNYNFEMEEFGLVVVDFVQRLITNKTLFLETILKIGKIASNFRPFWKQVTVRNSILRKTPKTMIKCAQLLIEGGDFDALMELFEDFKSDRFNAEDEIELEMMRAFAGMVRVITQDKEADTLSIGAGSSSVGTSGANVLPTDSIIAVLNSAVKRNAQVDWFLSLYSAFLSDEKGSDAAIALLLEYRDNNIDHLPAHHHLLEFLQRECQEDEQVLVKSAFKCCLDRFPFSQDYVLRYCEMLIKSAEDTDLDNSMELDHFEKDTSDDEEKFIYKRLSMNKEIITVTVNCLDYKTSSNNLTLWTYLAESLKQLCFNDPEASDFALNLFSSRLGWWSKQNSKHIARTEDQVLLKKAVVYLILFGAENEEYEIIWKALGERKEKSSSSLFGNLMKELEMVQQRAIGSLLDPYKRELLQDYDFIRQEWRKIKAMRVESEANDPRAKNQYQSKTTHNKPVTISPKAKKPVQRKEKPAKVKKPVGRPKKKPHWTEVRRRKEAEEAVKDTKDTDDDDDADSHGHNDDIQLDNE